VKEQLVCEVDLCKRSFCFVFGLYECCVLFLDCMSVTVSY